MARWPTAHTLRSKQVPRAPYMGTRSMPAITATDQAGHPNTAHEITIGITEDMVSAGSLRRLGS